MFTKDLQELRNKQTEMDNIVEELQLFNCRITEPEEQINELENRMVDITATEPNIKKKKKERKKRNEDNLRDLWNNIKNTKFIL